MIKLYNLCELQFEFCEESLPSWSEHGSTKQSVLETLRAQGGFETDNSVIAISAFNPVGHNGKYWTKFPVWGLQ